jgi:hypothetical protein
VRNSYPKKIKISQKRRKSLLQQMDLFFWDSISTSRTTENSKVRPQRNGSLRIFRDKVKHIVNNSNYGALIKEQTIHVDIAI